MHIGASENHSFQFNGYTLREAVFVPTANILNTHLGQTTISLMAVPDPNPQNPSNSWRLINGGWYYYTRNGRQFGWWHYSGTSGPPTGWYFLNPAMNGRRHYGWFHNHMTDQWHMFDPMRNGVMHTGWWSQGGINFYFFSTTGTLGVMAAGGVFRTSDGTYHEFDSGGRWIRRVTMDGWLTIGGDTFFYRNGVRQFGWLQWNGMTFMLDPSRNGALHLGWWLEMNNGWITGMFYFFGATSTSPGAMARGGVIRIGDGSTHRFADNGLWLYAISARGDSDEGIDTSFMPSVYGRTPDILPPNWNSMENPLIVNEYTRDMDNFLTVDGFTPDVYGRTPDILPPGWRSKEDPLITDLDRYANLEYNLIYHFVDKIIPHLMEVQVGYPSDIAASE
jgi:glucan-binding YG repeat protein